MNNYKKREKEREREGEEENGKEEGKQRGEEREQKSFAVARYKKVCETEQNIERRE